MIWKIAQEIFMLKCTGNDFLKLLNLYYVLNLFVIFALICGMPAGGNQECPGWCLFFLGPCGVMCITEDQLLKGMKNWNAWN